MDEIEKLQRANMYMQKLANGIDPITDTVITKDTQLNNVRLSKCFLYVSEILTQVIDTRCMIKGSSKSKKNTLPISDSIKKTYGIPLNELVDKIYVTQNTINCKIRHKWIYQWLFKNGFMEEYMDNYNRKQKKATAYGEGFGLKTISKNMGFGIFPVTLFNEKAQHLIISNLDKMISESFYNAKSPNQEYQGSIWSPDHEKILVDLFLKNVSVPEIAATLKRSENGIRARLKKLGLIDHRSDAL